MNKQYFIALALLLFASCQGNIHGEAGGRFETKSSSKTTVTINGKVVEERASESKNGGASEGEFDVVVGDQDPKEPIPDFRARVNCGNAISGDQFEKVKSEILGEVTDRNKILYLKRKFPDSCLNSEQIRDLAELFIMDKYRLDFAKSFYGHTVDKMNYYKVRETMVFDDSKEKLDQYVNEW